MTTHTRVISTRGVQFIPTQCDFHTQECNFDTLECDYDTLECDYDTLECDYDTLECDLYTQSVIPTRMIMNSTRTRLVSARIVRFYTQSVILHAECDFARIWRSLHTR
jgi:hypothetical protein